MKTKLPLVVARDVANHLVAYLKPNCKRIEVAGIIAALIKDGPIVAPPRVERPAPEPAVSMVAEIEADAGLAGSYLRGVRNAQKNQDRKKQIVKAKRRKKKAEAELV